MVQTTQKQSGYISMLWAIVLFLLVLVTVHWFEYKRTIQEYTFAQPMTIDQHGELRRILGEKTPVVVELGVLPWRADLAAKSAWSMVTAEGVHPSNEWSAKKLPILNNVEVAEQMELDTGLADLEEARAWWWLPGIWLPSVSVLPPGETAGLSWVSAERQWIGCSDGGPLLLWLVHSRYRRYLPSSSVNPWALTSATAPWIGRVQYIEVRIKSGWCIGLPAHWGWAIQNEGSDTAYWWSASQHSVVSLGTNIQPNIESLMTEIES